MIALRAYIHRPALYEQLPIAAERRQAQMAAFELARAAAFAASRPLLLLLDARHLSRGASWSTILGAFELPQDMIMASDFVSVEFHDEIYFVKYRSDPINLLTPQAPLATGLAPYLLGHPRG